MTAFPVFGSRVFLTLMVLAGLMLVAPARAVRAAPPVRIKDITEVAGEHTNKLTGYGLVTGLQGTGGTSLLTKRIAILALQKLGLRGDPRLLANLQQAQEKTDNLSVVMVTAELPPHAKPQQRIDVMVSAYDDAESLQGGTLMQTNLTGYDGRVYAIASGPVSINGGSFGGDAASVTKNHPTTGRIPGGAIIEEEVPTTVFRNNMFELFLLQSDHHTAGRIAAAINQLAPGSAQVRDPAAVTVGVPPFASADPWSFLSACQDLTVVPDSVARVVINERTGTIVIGNNVRISSVAIAHGNIIVSTIETPQVSQPAPFSDGDTVVVPNTTVDVTEQDSVVNLLEQTATVGDLAASLNALGVSPRDMSSIFQMLKEAGALHAHLEIR